MKPRYWRGNSASGKRSACPIANALDLLGDRWTLLVVRDLMFCGKRLYGELARCEEGIPTNILADRLKRLEAAGLVRREPYQDHPVRYEYALTSSGADLLPVMRELVRWAGKHIPAAGVPSKRASSAARTAPPGTSRRKRAP